MIKEKTPKSKRRKDTGEKTKKVSYYLGVKVECLENKITVNKFNNFAEVYYVKNQNCVKITERNTEIIKDIDYITDITDAMDGNMKWYMDDCHLLEPGNRIIADRILPVTIELVG